MLSAATARADNFTDILDNVQGSLAAGHSALLDAESDLATGISGIPSGLEAFDSFLNNDLLGTQQDLFVGTIDALQNDLVGGGYSFGEPSAPADLADAVSFSQGVIADGQAELATSAMDFASGDDTSAAYYAFEGSFQAYDFPAEQFLIGAIDQLLGL